MEPRPLNALVDRPLAAPGLTSYRYRSKWGYIMIGARDDNDALREALRSIETDEAPPRIANLEKWNGEQYEPA